MHICAWICMCSYPYTYRENLVPVKWWNSCFFMWCSNICAAKECQVPNETEMHGFARRERFFCLFVFYPLQSAWGRRQTASAGKVLSPAQSPQAVKWSSALNYSSFTPSERLFRGPAALHLDKSRQCRFKTAPSHVILPGGQSPTKGLTRKKKKNTIQICRKHQNHLNNLLAI